ncbi:MAG TPA: protein translocase subunit SecD [Candidatus Acidoferrales bacterium]|jgi:SecD/SecF fusion protein|nr:protein translocase subunit SecD [Candidatus Acidoferrales bacterium]
MNKNDRWKFILVVVIVIWALIQMNPPTSRDLVQQFASRAEATDATFTNILQKAEAIQKADTNVAGFAALSQAITNDIGTNDIQNYFPFINARGATHPTTTILNQLQRDASGKIKLGLDLQGGTSYLVQMDTNFLNTVAGATNSVSRSSFISGALAQAVEVLRKRVDALGVAEPVIQPVGENQILIQMPGLAESVKQQARENIQKAAYLEFRMVHDDSAAILQNHEPIPPGYEVLKAPLEPGQTMPEPFVVGKKAVGGLAGDFVTKAWVSYGNLGEPQINFSLTTEGAKEFAAVTTQYSPDPQTGQKHLMAIVLDGELASSPPYISGPIVDGECQITGHFTEEEAQGVASILENPLRAPLSIISASDVAPTLGSDSIHSGMWASIWAVIGVAAFMLFYYRLAGMTANVALVTNIIILLGVMCSLGTTLTLPGIAGIVLTIGMAVDANVLIYERLREELEKGKSLRGAIAAGYGRAFATIFDSHVTTLISSIILIWKGTGEIKGFGVTLTIGVIASLFTALVVTRIIFNFILDRNWIQTLTMHHIIRSVNINFMQVARPLFISTCIFAVAAVVYGGVARGDKLFGVDFLGGDSVTFKFSQQVDNEKIRSALTAIGQKDATIQYQQDVSGGKPTLRVTGASGSAQKIEQALETGFPEAHFVQVEEQEVGAIVGAQIRQSAAIACIFAMFGILVYVAFRYEFSFALGAIVAVAHDIVLTIGCYCIANAISGRQFNATVVAALLTIIGFSINDKVVIFDRIRENLKLGARGTFKEVINQALNQTLSRTIITSGTVFLATLALYIFGGGEINDFAFTFLVGIITGTYSSIYIATPFVLWWHKGQRPNIGASQVTMQNAPATHA